MRIALSMVVLNSVLCGAHLSRLIFEGREGSGLFVILGAVIVLINLPDVMRGATR